jgi:hypothetical protein
MLRSRMADMDINTSGSHAIWQHANIARPQHQALKRHKAQLASIQFVGAGLRRVNALSAALQTASSAYSRSTA